jgi:hypothetical protein
MTEFSDMQKAQTRRAKRTFALPYLLKSLLRRALGITLLRDTREKKFYQKKKKVTSKMGRRFRPKKKYFQKSSSSASSDVVSQTAAHFSVKDEKILFRYLEEYKRRALHLFCCSGSSSPVAGQKKRKFSIEEEETSTSTTNDSPINIIGGFEFPALTDDVASKPYLQFPNGLSGKQRQVVHRLCEDGR